MSTVSLSDERPVDPVDEQLVAYLDGELAANDRSDLEERLLKDETLRIRLQELQQSWDWLDQLPPANPSNKLVESTLELVVSDVMEASPKHRAPLKRWAKPIGLVAVCLLVPLLAFGFVSWRRHADFTRQLEELAIAENLQAYLEADDLNFVRELANNPDWNQMVDAAREVGVIPSNPASVVASIPLDERAERLPDLDSAKRDVLAERWARFELLSQSDRGELWDTHRIVMQQTDRETLLETMKNFAAWKATLPAKLADQIEGRDPETDAGPPRSREQALQAAIDLTTREVQKRSGRKLDSESTQRIIEALEFLAIERISAPHAEQDEGTVQEYEKALDDVRSVAELSNRKPRELALRRVLPWLVWTPDRAKWVADRFDIEQPPKPLTSQELARLETLAGFSSSDRRVLDVLAGNDPASRQEILRLWADEAVDRVSPWARQEDTMLDMYLRRDPDEREQLDLQDPAAFAEELSHDRRRRGSRSRSGRGGRSND